MDNLTDAVKAIILISTGVGLISFMFVLGTLLAPVAVAIFATAIVYIAIKEARKYEDKKTKKKKRKK